MGCVFCQIINEEIESYVVYETEKTLAFLDINPATEYHILVVPKKHYVDIFEIPQEEYVEIQKTVHHIVNKLKQNGISAVNILNSNGKAAGQDVFHMHVHIIPRLEQDSIRFTYDVDLGASATLEKSAQKLREIIQ